jgi:hypothetical protein
VFTASAETKRALAPLGATYTAFTGVLIDLLNQGIPGGPELLSMQTLHVHALAHLRNQRPELASRGPSNLVCIAKNTQPTTVPPTPDAATVVVPALQPPTLPSRLPALIRQRLLERRRSIKGLTVVGSGLPLPAWLDKESRWFGLAEDEELIGVWRWPARPRLFSRGRGWHLVFTSRGLRIPEGSHQMMFPYTNFGNTSFSSSSRVMFSGSVEMSDVHIALMTISDADTWWTSPDVHRESAVVHGLAAVLTEIKAIVTGTTVDTDSG